MTAPRRPSFGEPRGAFFLDRDGTIIEDRHYLRDPDQVELVAGATNAIRYINYALMPVVVVTNQSGIARGMFTDAEYQLVKARLDDVLSERNAFIDATYYCPHHPDFTGPCYCRKPGTSLYLQAATDLRLDLKRSVYIGDRWHDVVVAQTLGGRGILVPSRDTPADEMTRASEQMEVAASLTAAVYSVLGPPPAGINDVQA